MSEPIPGGATVHDLIRQREQLTGWISRLDEVGGQASTRAAERIRADYVDRLRRVNESLSSHRGEIEADLQRFRGALGQAEELRLSAADEMDEASLRHLIGELDESAWNEARPDLEARVREADDAVAQAREEVLRLETLAADIASAENDAAALAEAAAPPEEPEPEPAAYEAEPEPASEETPGSPFDREATADFEPELPADDLPSVGDVAAAAAAETTFEAPPPADVREAADAVSADEWDPFGSEFGTEPKQGDAEEDLPWLEGIDQSSTGAGGGGWTPPPAGSDEGLDFLREIEESTRPAAEPAADLGADDLAFLEELDRSIGSGSGSAGRGAKTPPPAQPATTPPPAAAATPGSRAEPLLCKECGAINEPHSWYCEICGSEL
ncbi:MAG TPA: Ran-binding zinc finger domain-containing protein [Longimicrobium sp.]|nr:Ran-binding zinc finger domain-containing protein [Longimicrobium sp.]